MGIYISGKDKLIVISNLATMLAAGIPIVEAVDSILTESKGGSQKFLQIVRRTLNDGKPLSDAFALAPHAFDPVTVNLIKASEEAGTLESGLKELARTIKKDTLFRDKLKASLTYPAFILVTFFGVLTMILTVVIPRISQVFSGMRIKMPLATRVLIRASNFLLADWRILIAGLIVLTILLVMLYRLNRRAFINVLFSLPGVSHLGVQIDLTRFSRSMSTLLHAGLPILEALSLSQEVVSKRSMRQTLYDCKNQVQAGKPLSEGLRMHRDVIPAMMIQIVEAAEASGTLDSTLKEMADYYELQVNRSLKTFSTLLEPISLIVIGGLVGGMMLAVIAPIYNMISQIRAR